MVHVNTKKIVLSLVDLKKVVLLQPQIEKWLQATAGVAQLVEQLICNQLVGGSSPFTGSLKTSPLQVKLQGAFSFKVHNLTLN
jgi:hypothetical protein